MNWRTQLQQELDHNNRLRAGSIYRRGDSVSEHVPPLAGDELTRADEVKECLRLCEKKLTRYKIGVF